MLVEHTVPWQHYIFDNFLEQRLFNKLVQMRTHKDFKFIDCWSNNMIVTEPVPDCPTKKHINVYNDSELSKLIDNNIKQKLSTILPEKYFCIPDLVSCDPGYVYPSHVDHQAKIFSIVVYLYPPKANGTVLLGHNMRRDIEWKPNRALIIKNNNHTLHYYHNNTNYQRLTLNVYITTDSNRPFTVSTFDA